LTDLLSSEELGFAEEVCSVRINKTIEEITGGKDVSSDFIAKNVRDALILNSFGLKFILEVQKDLVLSTDVIELVFNAFCAIALRKQAEPKEIPTVPEGADDEEKTKIEAEAEKIKADNDKLVQTNAKLA
jgi:hypothetical protein